ncbi:MAG: hypothetical protein IBJ03_13285 [Gemmatimonadaceae bacterium]|nr:hypothetical protein [Gemmatimonadaceae bacterium]
MGAGLRRIGALALLVSAAACYRSSPTPSPIQPVLPRIPRDAPRFEIDSVTDSTATFRVQEIRWLRAGMQSYVIDPHQRDALVARMRIVRSDSLTATALITSQVGRVKTEHFVLVLEPHRPWWKARTFWWGSVIGAALGASIVALL